MRVVFRLVLAALLVMFICAPAFAVESVYVGSGDQSSDSTTYQADSANGDINSADSNTGDSNDQTASKLPYKTVPPEVFVNRVGSLMDMGVGAINQVINRFAGLMIAISCIVLIGGVIFGSGKVKTMGWGGLVCAVLGLLIFHSIPLIVGLIKAVSQTLGS